MGDYRTTSGEEHPLPEKDARRRRRRILTWLSVGLFVVLMLGFSIRVPRRVAVSGHVTTIHYAEVRPAVSGRVAEILLSSGAKVEEGAVLARLDAAEENGALEEALSRVGQAEAQLLHRSAEVAEARRVRQEQIAMAELKLRNATAKRERTRELLEKGLASGAALEDETMRAELAAVELRTLVNQDLSLDDKALVVLEQELAARKDAAERAAAAVRARMVCAPIAGLVVRYEFVVGELVRPENVLFEVYGGDRLILKLRVPERYATRVAQGHRYRAVLASYAGLRRRIFKGQIEALRDVIQSDGPSTYRVAYASFDPDEHQVPPGTTVEADIYYGSSSLWAYLLGLY